jgi:5-oxoprolinase (ATP-hydrolysing) subunit A
MTLSPQAIAHAVTYQLGALEAFARIAGTRLAHVKPHGALYNLAARDEVTANAIAQAVAAYDPNLILVGLGGSALVDAGITAGLRVANEGFPDRAYLPDGQLMPRDQAGALISDPKQVASNAVHLVREGFSGGGDQSFRIDTLCLHGDHHSAVDNARLVRGALEDAGVEIRPLAQILNG